MEFAIVGSESWKTDAFQDRFINECFKSKSSVSSADMTVHKRKKTKKRKKCDASVEDPKQMKKRKVESSTSDPVAQDRVSKPDISKRLMNLTQSSDTVFQKQPNAKSLKRNQVKTEHKKKSNKLSTEKKNKKHSETPKGFLKRNTSEHFPALSSNKQMHNGHPKTNVSQQGETQKFTKLFTKSVNHKNFDSIEKQSMKKTFPKNKKIFKTNIIKVNSGESSSTQAKFESSSKFHVESALPRNYENNKKRNMKKHFSKNIQSHEKLVFKGNADENVSTQVKLQKPKKLHIETTESAFPRNYGNNKKWNIKKNSPKNVQSHEEHMFKDNGDEDTSAQVKLQKPKKLHIETTESAFPRNYGYKKWGKNKNRNFATNDARKTFPSDVSTKWARPDCRSIALKENAMLNLQAAKFRILNEKLYTVTGDEAYQFFNDNSEAFADYHLGYEQQVKKWPINPVDIIINSLRQLPKSNVIADLGCGDAKIARTLPKIKVHSFDLVAINEHVTCCDMAKVPLPNKSVDIAVFCLSLMGVNLDDYLREASRILKMNGLLKIAEVESRIEDLDKFVKAIEAYGFTQVNKDISHKMFVLLDFRKVKKKNKKSNSPAIQLQPCLYKKR